MLLGDAHLVFEQDVGFGLSLIIESPSRLNKQFVFDPYMCIIFSWSKLGNFLGRGIRFINVIFDGFGGGGE